MLQNEMQRLTSRNLTEGRDFADVILDDEDDQLKKPGIKGSPKYLVMSSQENWVTLGLDFYY